MSDQDALAPRVLIVRHGETEWAKTGRFTSFTEIDLTQKGVTQVLSAAAKLVGPGKLLDLCQLVHVFVSPRVRAKKTFELLLPVPSDVLAGKVTYTDTITEWNYGEYEGLTDPEIRHLRKSNGLDKESQWDIWADGCEGGESKQHVTERLDRLILQIRDVQRHSMRGEKPADVLVVAHGLILRCFVKRWLGLSIDATLPMVFAPGAFAILSYKNNDVNKPAFHLGLCL